MKYAQLYKKAKYIHEKIFVCNGSKVFPPEVINIEVRQKLFDFSPTPPVLSIIIPSYFRLEELFETINSIFDSNIDFPYEIIIWDNSFVIDIFNKIVEFAKNIHSANINIARIIIRYDPYPNFPNLRNKAVLECINKKSKIIAFWDSDMLSSKKTVQRVVENLLQSDDLYGLAPAMVASDNVPQLVKNGIEKSKDLLQMPGSIGEQLGTYYNSKILLTGLMRGCFFLKRQAIDTHLKTFGFIFPLDFTVWSNVPFFAGLRELNLKYGYLYEDSTYVIHNDKVGEFTMGQALNNKVYENLKALVLIAMRNKLYIKKYFQLNNTFNKLSTWHLSNLLTIKFDEAANIYKELVSVAKALDTRKVFTSKIDLINDVYSYVLKTVNVKVFKTYKSLNFEIGLYNTKYG